MVHSLVCELYQLSVRVCNTANVYVYSVVIPKGCAFLTKLSTPFVWNFISQQAQCFKHYISSMNVTDWQTVTNTH